MGDFINDIIFIEWVRSTVQNHFSDFFFLFRSFDDLPPIRQRAVMGLLMEKCVPFNTETRDRYYETVVTECQRRITDGAAAYIRNVNGANVSLVDGIRDYLIEFINNLVPIKVPQVMGF